MTSYSGIVQKGKKRGTALGYPTANIELPKGLESGVYAARVDIKDHERYMAAVFADDARRVLEAHILDFSDDLYGLEIKVELYKKIRESKKFDTDRRLRAAIADDVAKVREYFKD